MLAQFFRSLSKLSLAVISLSLAPAPLTHAGVIAWTDWTTSNGTGGFTALGKITTSTATVDVTYNNPQGVSFFQNGIDGDLTDYFASGGGGVHGRVDAANSPYTSSLVENIPTAAEMIALRYAGSQSLTFSQAIANPVFSYVSLNGNGYAFDQDFDILSFGDGINKDSGFWGTGTSSKTIVNTLGGGVEYQLIGTGEPHGTIRFKGAFTTVSWRSLSDENWNGFTVGVQGTAQEVFSTVPETSSIATWAVLSVVAGFKWHRSRRS